MFSHSVDLGIFRTVRIFVAVLNIENHVINNTISSKNLQQILVKLSQIFKPLESEMRVSYPGPRDVWGPAVVQIYKVH